jgi:hypothetical protein
VKITVSTNQTVERRPTMEWTHPPQLNGISLRQPSWSGGSLTCIRDKPRFLTKKPWTVYPSQGDLNTLLRAE